MTLSTRRLEGLPLPILIGAMALLILYVETANAAESTLPNAITGRAVLADSIHAISSPRR